MSGSSGESLHCGQWEVGRTDPLRRPLIRSGMSRGDPSITQLFKLERKANATTTENCHRVWWGVETRQGEPTIRWRKIESIMQPWKSEEAVKEEDFQGIDCKGQSTPLEEKDRVRQTTWANCLQQSTSMLSTAVMRSVQITSSPNSGSADHHTPLIKHRR